MAILDFNHLNLRAPPALLEKLRAFYCDVLGLTAGYRPPVNSVGYWLYAGERVVLHLSTALPEEPQPTEATTTFNHIAFSCADVTAFEQRLKQHGVSYRVGGMQLGQIQIFLKDPAGNGVELNFASADR
jgi:extradiol dioxygenase family protein